MQAVLVQNNADPTVYLEEDTLGEHELQTYILEVLRPLLARYLAERGVLAHVGSDQFIYWVQYQPQTCMVPDIYVLPGVSQDIAISVWKVWEQAGIVPNFVLELVGLDRREDYEEAPKRCAELGVAELFIVDPWPGPERVQFQVYRRQGERLVCVEKTDADRAYSEQLGCFLRAVGQRTSLRLRPALGETGETLMLTAEEAERAAKEAALQRVRELEALLRSKE